MRPLPPEGSSPSSPRLAAFAMGEAGRASRVLASAWGSAAVWASADPSAPGAPGQIDVRSLLGLYRFRNTNPRTLVFGVAGAPVSRSLSPAIHNEAFRFLGLDAVYVALACGSASELDALLERLPLEGVSITAPLKVEALRLLDEADGTVERTGACNTIVVRRSPRAVRCGFNTDGAALLEEVRQHLDPAGRRALVVGAGGAARAAAFAMAGAGARVMIAARRTEEGETLARDVGGVFCPIASIEPDPERILIQATSAPLEDMVVPGPAHGAAVLIDMRYGPGEAALVASARRHGTPTADGLGMLARQAREQLRLFTGRDIPLPVLLEAAARWSGDIRP